MAHVLLKSPDCTGSTMAGQEADTTLRALQTRSLPSPYQRLMPPHHDPRCHTGHFSAKSLFRTFQGGLLLLYSTRSLALRVLHRAKTALRRAAASRRPSLWGEAHLSAVKPVHAHGAGSTYHGLRLPLGRRVAGLRPVPRLRRPTRRAFRPRTRGRHPAVGLVRQG